MYLDRLTLCDSGLREQLGSLSVVDRDGDFMAYDGRHINDINIAQNKNRRADACRAQFECLVASCDAKVRRTASFQTVCDRYRTVSVRVCLDDAQHRTACMFLDDVKIMFQSGQIDLCPSPVLIHCHFGSPRCSLE